MQSLDLISCHKRLTGQNSEMDGVSSGYVNEVALDLVLPQSRVIYLLF